ncbi:SDR family NAD(P)-dependent oxidoreductase [Dactylosporangium sp. CA-139114]|uniref:SDR family NAD(P)-dependent oxidoreductase n=1 Tax=Dactylosporangium sp. CA-139114 TaxID=3239931 RepID=UPI003D9A084A
MTDWSLIVSPADGRTRTTEELVALPPALGETLGIDLGFAGDDLFAGTGRDERGDPYWPSGMLGKPGEFGRYESYQFDIDVQMRPGADQEAIVTGLYNRVRAGGRFHAVVTRNFAAILASVFTGSTAAHRGSPGTFAYAASKGALISLTRSLAVELAASGVRVNSVCPGWIDTPFNDPYRGAQADGEAAVDGVVARVPLGRQGDAEEVAALITYLLSPGAASITGQSVVIDGGLLSA